MSNREKPTSDEGDEFSRIIQGLEGLGDGLRFDERGEYSEVDVAGEMRRLRAAYEDHVKAALELNPSAPLSDEDVVFIVYLLNKTDVPALDEALPGRTMSIGEGAFTAYATEAGTAYENIAEGERISGQIVRYMVFPMPSMGMLMAGEQASVSDDSDMEYEIGVLLSQPVFEDEFGRRMLPYDEMFVSISDPSVLYRIRLTA